MVWHPGKNQRAIRIGRYRVIYEINDVQRKVTVMHVGHRRDVQLPPKQQHQVLEFARSLVAARVRGMPGKSLLRFAGTIEPDDLATMKQAIEEGCERVNQNNW